MSEELKEDLARLGLASYASSIIIAGYDDWVKVADMTETDFEALGIRLGDRRKLQREIARRQLWPDGSPLPTPDELREFTLSRGEDSKNGVQDLVSEAKVNHPAYYDFSSYQQEDSGGGEGTIDLVDTTGQTPGSSDSIPAFQLDAEMHDFEEHNAPEEMNHSYLSAPEEEFEDEVTPTGVGDAVRPTLSQGNFGEWKLE